MVRIYAIVLAATLAAIPEARAQHVRVCETTPPPFPLNASNRIDPNELAGKSMLYVRRRLVDPGGFLRFRRELRGDGSQSLVCRAGPSPEGPWTLCRQFMAPTGAVVHGDREIGIWTIRGGYLC